MTRDEHIAAAEKWLARAEWFAGHNERHITNPDHATAAAGIATAHAALAGVSPIIVTMHRQNSPAGQGHDGQEMR